MHLGLKRGHCVGHMALVMRFFCVNILLYVSSVLVVLVDYVSYLCAITDLQYLLYITTGCSST